MAILSENDRVTEWAGFMSDISIRREPIALVKQDLRDAINAVDDWVDTNTAAFNQALPVAARTFLTATQKAELLMRVVRRRFEVT